MENLLKNNQHLDGGIDDDVSGMRMLLAKFGPSTNAGWDVVGGGSSSGSEGGGYPSWFSLLAPIGGLLAMGVIAALLYGKYNP